MSQYQNRNNDVDITKEELRNLKEAFKKEEFRTLFNNYVQEINDPENKALYEKELTELERERGIQVTFIHPKDGYVIKSSVNGERKAFINICHNDNVARPVSTPMNVDGNYGLNWSLPYLQSPPREDFTDKSNKYCIIFDVVFHSDTLHLANKDQQFKKLVNDTAITAVEDNFKVILDKQNIKFPKSRYKGYKQPTVIRKRISQELSDVQEIPNYPYKEPVEEEPKVVNPRSHVTNKDNFTVPKYIIKYRRNVDIQDFTYRPDSKMNVAIPHELQIEVELPLIHSVDDLKLDVAEKHLSLFSEKPAKYKLNIDLPYAVNEDDGNAKFDKSTKKLIVVLPVIHQTPKLENLMREDSGVESDIQCTIRSSSDEDISLESNERTNSSVKTITSSKNLEFFLSHVPYTFPNCTVSKSNNIIKIQCDVKHIDPKSIDYRFIAGGGFEMKMLSLGTGYFPINYSLGVIFPNYFIDENTFGVEYLNENLIIKLSVKSNLENVSLSEYMIGLNSSNLAKFPFNDEFVDGNKINSNDTIHHNFAKQENLDSDDEDLIFSSKNEKIDISDGVSNIDLNYNNNQISLKEDTQNKGAINIKHKRRGSESSKNLPARRGILKLNRSLSESNTEDYTGHWSSVESEFFDETINGGSLKKSVTFNDHVLKNVYRPNSSILGQRKKNQRKSRNKTKAIERRLSESEQSEMSEVSEISDLSEVSDVSESDDGAAPSNLFITVIPSSKKSHRRRGKKNQRKNANTAKHSNIFFMDNDN